MCAEKRWILPQIENVPESFQRAIGGHPLVAQTLYQRGVRSLTAARAFLDPDFYHPAPPSEFDDMGIACDLLIQAIHKGQHILVWGDFDVDGQTSTTLLVEGLRQLGAKVSFHIPVRAEESHGIKQAVLKEKLKTGFDLLLTCDTGISEHANLQILRNLGIPVIVTDHHTLGEGLPPANAIINPQRLTPNHPLRTLPGVGVAYKLIEGLTTDLGASYNPGDLLDLVALGIVADVAELQGDTRCLLQRGLRQLRETPRLGLQMLYQNTDLIPANLNEGHIGFQIGPRLNAVGRLGDANPMVDFLTTEDPGRARLIAYQIEALNTKRRFDTRQVERAAEMQLSASSADRHAPAIILHHPTWPGGIVGIVASRLVERFHKPVILLTGEDPVHGSARSVTEMNITEAIAAQSDLLVGYGGHPMAAGLSLPASNLSAFKRRFLATVEEQLRDIAIVQEVHISSELSLDQLNLDLVREIERLGPFGTGNPPLLFLVRDLKLVSESQVGANQEHRQVTVADGNDNELRLIWWNGGDESLPDLTGRFSEAQFDLVCKLTRSDYKGSPQLSAEWVDYRLSEAGCIEITQRQIEINDYRDAVNPISQLQQYLQKNPAANLWGEGDLPANIPFMGRHELGVTPHLIVWTVPASQSILRQVIRQTRPQTVTVFGIDPLLDDLNRFMTRLGGAAKYAMANLDGFIPLSRLAAACAAEDLAVRIGLQLWQARGAINLAFEGESVYITPDAPGPNPSESGTYHNILRTLLEESRAFRGYFRKGDLQALIVNETIP